MLLAKSGWVLPSSDWRSLMAVYLFFDVRKQAANGDTMTFVIEPALGIFPVRVAIRN